MSERPDTWMPIYWGDYAKDTGHLSATLHGAYLMLIKHYWVFGAPLPDDDAQLWRIACADSIQHWRKLRAILAPLFEVADGVWRHERVDKELALAIKRQEKARRAASIRWASNGHAPIGNAQSMPQHCPSDALHNSPSSSVATNSSVTPSTPPASRAQLLTEKWEPTEGEVKDLRAELSWINDDLWDSRMKQFRDWCVANAVRTFDPAASWRGFMRQTRKPFEGKQWAKAGDVSLMPAAEEWGPRMSGWRQSKFWRRERWGPPPDEPGCRVPRNLLGADA
jgi:uncharacterized protein YdaU (DUF1376 family)